MEEWGLPFFHPFYSHGNGQDSVSWPHLSARKLGVWAEYVPWRKRKSNLVSTTDFTTIFNPKGYLED